MKITEAIRKERSQTLASKVIGLIQSLPEGDVLTSEEIAGELLLTLQYVRTNLPRIVPKEWRLTCGRSVYYGKPKALKTLHEGIRGH